jgi:hypothetical protein
VQPCDSLSVVLQKMNEQICDIWEILNSLTTTTSTTSTTTAAPVCKTYTAIKEDTFNIFAIVEYTDCFGTTWYQQLNSSNSRPLTEIDRFTFCAIEGSVIAPNDVTVTDEGVCSNPKMTYMFETKYNAFDSTTACISGIPLTVYSNSATLDGINPFLTLDTGLSTSVQDGYYCLASGCPNSSGKQWVRVTGGSGAITQSANC